MSVGEIDEIQLNHEMQTNGLICALPQYDDLTPGTCTTSRAELW
jgi:hypothetical protein